MFSVKIKGEFAVGTEEKDMGQIAVQKVTAGEKSNTGRPRYTCNWQEFGKFVIIWIITATILFFALFCITIVRGSDYIIYDTIKEVDTLNMMFSLVLSALLEQMWSKNGKGGLYKITLATEGGLTIAGGMLFMAYSIVEITDMDNQLKQMSFEINMGYIIISIIVVLLGFFSRAIREKV